MIAIIFRNKEMIILKKISTEVNKNDFKNSILNETKTWIGGYNRSNGVYSKIHDDQITLISVENDFSLRTGSFNAYFYGKIIKFRKKCVLIGYAGPSWIYTLFSLLVLISPFEYIYIRFIALFFWIIVYVTDFKRINYLKDMVINKL